MLHHATLRRIISCSFSSLAVNRNKLDLNINEIVHSLCKDNDDDARKKLLFIHGEYQSLKETGAKVPKRLTLEDYKELLNLRTNEWFRFLLSKYREEEKIASVEPSFSFRNSNRIIRDYDESDISIAKNYRMIPVLCFSQNFVIDCSTSARLPDFESRKIARHLVTIINVNKTHIGPFNIHLCNFGQNKAFSNEVLLHIPDLLDEAYPIYVTEKSYVDVFSREELAYISLSAPYELQYFNHRDVYIMSIFDLLSKSRYSDSEARRNNVHLVSLPVKRTFPHASFRSYLPPIQLMKVMLDMKYCNNWNKALSHYLKWHTKHWKYVPP